MPSKKKAAPFMTFVKEYQTKNVKLTLEQAIHQCNIIWTRMTQTEKNVYKNKSKFVCLNLGDSEKYTSQGKSISIVENERQERERDETAILNEITETVARSRNMQNLGVQKYYFLMGNYFYHQSQGDVYYPAEIAICEYSLNNGVMKKYHSLLNPKNDIFGYTFEAQNHSNNTHGLPLPPKDALGETNLAKVYQHLYDFISNNNKVEPLYTHCKNIRFLESMLLYMQDEHHVGNKIRIFPLQQLFYELKKVTAEIGNTRKPTTIHITNTLLDRDYYEHQIGIACDVHEHMDKSKYCALSYVIRWAYTFSDNMCTDLNIDVQPGYHVPHDIDMTLVETGESFRSANTEECSEFGGKSDKNYNEVALTEDSSTSFESFSHEPDSYDDGEYCNPFGVRSKLNVKTVDEDSFCMHSSLTSRGRGIKLINLFKNKTEDTESDLRSSAFAVDNSVTSQRTYGRGKPFY